jgi:hypothetical protein
MNFNPNLFVKNQNESKDGFLADKVAGKQSLGEGVYARVREVLVKKGNHEKTFALKDYKTKSNLENAKLLATNAFNHYLRAKESGLKVVPTLRISDDSTELLTTLLTNENISLIDSGSSKKWGNAPLIQDIDNIREITEQLVENAIKASDAEIVVSGDAYAFVIDNNKISHLNFFLFDFDLVESIEELGSYYDNILEGNLKNAHFAFKNFVYHCIPEENREEIKQKFDIDFNSLVSKINKDKYMINYSSAGRGLQPRP